MNSLAQQQVLGRGLGRVGSDIAYGWRSGKKTKDVPKKKKKKNKKGEGQVIGDQNKGA